MKASPGPHPVYKMLEGQLYSKTTPLIYNLDRILHTAGASLLEKRPANMVKVFETYIHICQNIKSEGPLVDSLLKMLWLLLHNPTAHHSTGTWVHAFLGIRINLCAMKSSTSYHCSGFFSDRRDGKNAIQCSIHVRLYLRGRNSHTTKKNSYVHPSQL